MRKREYESFFKEFRRKRAADPGPSNDDIIDQIFEESPQNQIRRIKLRNYVKEELKRLRKEEREGKSEKSKIFSDETLRKMRRGATEAVLRDDVQEAILKGKISKEDLTNKKFEFKGRKLSDLGFGPPR